MRPARIIGPCAALLFLSALLTGCASSPEPRFGEPTRTDVTLDSRLRIAEQLYDGGNFQNAYSVYRRASEDFPDAAEPLIGMGRVLFALGALDRAAQVYEQALELAPQSPEALRGRANVLLMEGRADEALSLLARAEAAGDQPQPALHNSMGMALDLLGRHAEAQVHYGEALAQSDNAMRYRNNLALSFAFSGDFETAIGLMSEIIDSPQSSPRARQNLALIYGLAGRIEDARRLGLRDLGEQEMAANLAYYQELRQLPSSEQARQILLSTAR